MTSHKFNRRSKLLLAGLVLFFIGVLLAMLKDIRLLQILGLLFILGSSTLFGAAISTKKNSKL